ncbi:hypothetical protein E2562_014912 [Oryza meyeriana var. granulata]|uniref:KIB1-4 beta-propeller domain-containing protein n=1 Tax=Oryza meyeriana var. granulata TaxID=110450 RepID=A0A6G1EJN4_9ORYZ|nr:hypothetical protein E2562_014912 [Oryza meyeriana var. granulata]
MAVEPLFDGCSTVFDAAAAFAPPYDTVRKFTGAKNLVICDDGSLYQIWRNTSCTVIALLPGGGRCRIPANHVIVLRYYPHRRPCWVAVKDIGGCSVFIGKNNAVTLRRDGGDAPGLRGNCVYWIGGTFGRDQSMVFDIATRKSAPCFPNIQGHLAICWYYLGDTRSKSSSNSRTVETPAYQLQKRAHYA